MLIGGSGIGPKTAIGLLSSVTPDEFKRRLSFQSSLDDLRPSARAERENVNLKKS